MTSLKTKILFYYVYLAGISLSLFLVLYSSNLVLWWVALELNLYFNLVLIYYNSPYTLSELKKSLLSLQVYFLFQALGSLFILSGLVLWSKLMFFILGVCLKVSLVPFIWWFPQMASLLNWFKLFNLLTVGKLVPFLLIVFLVRDVTPLVIVVSILSLSISSVMLPRVIKNLKLVLAWTSSMDSCFLMGLIYVDWSSFIIYFLLYSSVIGSICYFFSEFEKGFQKKSGVASSGFLMIISGLPPLISFLYKLFLLYTNVGEYQHELSKSFLYLLFMVLVLFIQGSLYFYMGLVMMMDIFNWSLMSKSSLLSSGGGSVILILWLVIFFPLLFSL